MRDFSIGELEELYDMQEILQREAARRVPMPAAPEYISELRRLNEAYLAAGKAGSKEESSRINTEFHTYMHSGCGNRFLADTFDQLAGGQVLAHISAQPRQRGGRAFDCDDRRRIPRIPCPLNLRPGPTYQRRAKLAERGDTKHRHVAVDLLRQESDRVGCACLATDHRGKKEGAANEHGMSAKRERFQDIRTTPPPASVSPGAAAAIAGSACRLSIAPSNCRPPWFETMIPSMPADWAITASSGARMPFSTSLPGHRSRIRRTWSQLKLRAGRYRGKGFATR